MVAENPAVFDVQLDVAGLLLTHEPLQEVPYLARDGRSIAGSIVNLEPS